MLIDYLAIRSIEFLELLLFFLKSFLDGPYHLKYHLMEIIGWFEVIISLVLFTWPHLLLLFVSHLYQVLRILKVKVLQDIEDFVILCENVL